VIESDTAKVNVIVGLFTGGENDLSMHNGLLDYLLFE
jgi:hypothetical protein